MKYPCPGCVVHPPVDGKRYKVTKKGSKLTLINLFERKGGLIFQQLARMLPDRDFLGVEGGYGKQEKAELKNVVYMENTNDAKKIYAQTKVLLMPSLYESYGRTAVEAMASGIPVIANSTPGLTESLGEAGIYAPIEKLDEWVKEIRRLEDPDEYSKASKKCLDRFKEITLQSKTELEAMENFIFDVIERKI
jgi:glycosyltransferase involved in cell wall biosynthesis